MGAACGPTDESQAEPRVRQLASLTRLLTRFRGDKQAAAPLAQDLRSSVSGRAANYRAHPVSINWHSAPSTAAILIARPPNRRRDRTQLLPPHTLNNKFCEGYVAQSLTTAEQTATREGRERQTPRETNVGQKKPG